MLLSVAIAISAVQSQLLVRCKSSILWHAYWTIIRRKTANRPFHIRPVATVPIHICEYGVSFRFGTNRTTVNFPTTVDKEQKRYITFFSFRSTNKRIYHVYGAFSFDNFFSCVFALIQSSLFLALSKVIELVKDLA